MRSFLRQLREPQKHADADANGSACVRRPTSRGNLRLERRVVRDAVPVDATYHANNTSRSPGHRSRLHRIVERTKRALQPDRQLARLAQMLLERGAHQV